MVKLTGLNSRMKDFYDLWLLSRQFDFSGPERTEAMWLTLERRGTGVPSELVAFSDTLVDDKQAQWAAFRGWLQQEQTPHRSRKSRLS